MIKNQRDEISEYLSLLDEISRSDPIRSQTVCENLYKMSMSDQIQVMKMKVSENKVFNFLYEKYFFGKECK